LFGKGSLEKGILGKGYRKKAKGEEKRRGRKGM